MVDLDSVRQLNRARMLTLLGVGGLLISGGLWLVHPMATGISLALTSGSFMCWLLHKWWLQRKTASDEDLGYVKASVRRARKEVTRAKESGRKLSQEFKHLKQLSEEFSEFSSNVSKNWDGTKAVWRLTVPSFKDGCTVVLRRLAKLGYRQTSAPTTNTIAEVRQYECGTIVVMFSSLTCRRVKVGSHTVEIDDYEIQCE